MVHEFVSRLITLKVAKHCGAKTNQTSKDNAVGKLQWDAMTEESVMDTLAA